MFLVVGNDVLNFFDLTFRTVADESESEGESYD